MSSNPAIEVGEAQYSARSFDPVRLAACIAAIEVTFPDARLSVKRPFDEKTGEEARSLLREKWDGLRTFVLRFSEEIVNVTLRSPWDVFYIDIEGGTEDFQKKLHTLIRDTLGLLPASDDEVESNASLYAINQRIRKLQRMVADLSQKIERGTSSSKLRCFVSFRFDEHNKALALELRNFLELAGLEFVSGLGYEPRSVSAKVLDRLKGEIDLFLVIFSSSGESSWLRQEIGVAKARDLPIMVLRESGADFDEGLLSDIEYASFSANNISGTFIPVLEAARYVQMKRLTASSKSV